MGSAAAAGDFDGDRYDDLAISSPAEDLDAGSVAVWSAIAP